MSTSLEPWAKQENLILVDENDIPLEFCEKFEAHKKNLLHRAFSVFIFNSQGQTLLQQRAKGKYHSPELWTNTCCGHPRPGEDLAKAAMRRLHEEMNFFTPLYKHFTTRYQITFDNGLSENEIVHVFYGLYDGTISPDANEVQAWVWKDIETIERDIESKDPLHEVTFWFNFYFEKHKKELLEMQQAASSLKTDRQEQQLAVNI